ncbi:hypothetical protein PanWU01x14_222830 [Parasponia andersonii]|uniref:Uncharacterized protein n=1 Tax=Parasponia andersonii TaxID=3476 RepID=A0A2P5BNP0_PARAD|nr:hypothetical protein PanWU01x14_222830 [Parasponia andersonii]
MDVGFTFKHVIAKIKGNHTPKGFWNGTFKLINSAKIKVIELEIKICKDKVSREVKIDEAIIIVEQPLEYRSRELIPRKI